MSDLNTTRISALQPGGVLRDDKVKGLHLRATGQKKSFYLYYRTKGGKERRPRLGDYPNMTLGAARTAAKAILGRVAAGEDPGGQWLEDRSALRMNDLFDRYIERHVPKKKRGAEDIRIIDKYLRPAVGSKALKEVDTDTVHTVFTRWTRRHGAFQANRALAVMSKALSLAVAWRLAAPGFVNPCRGVERNKEPKRETYIRPEEARLIAAGIAAWPVERRFLFLLLALTGARPDEMCGKKIAIGGSDTIRLTEHKTARFGTERVIFLTPSIITAVKQERLEGVTLPTYSALTQAWQRLRTRLKLEHIRLYDLRHTFASVALAQGKALDQIGGLLGHSSATTTKRYTHLMDDPRRQWANEIATDVEAMFSTAGS